ncbi:MAG: class I SAM-dependent methyltransferase, partial [Gemmatimonadota bacterium]|nr:class I SAM-dependent methyltransferase [Gemmatimonadota bacterium]
MNQSEKKYRYQDRLWTWEELDSHIDRLAERLDRSHPDRVSLALGMVEGVDVLDLGCHLAIYSCFLAVKGHRVVGADVDRETLEIAKKKYSHPNLRIVLLDGERLDFEDNSFDCVLLLEVLEHCQDPRGLVREIHRVLRPGGSLVLSVPNAASYHTFARSILLNIPSYFRKMESWPEFAYDQRDHYFYWDPFTLYRLLNKEGFKY